MDGRMGWWDDRRGGIALLEKVKPLVSSSPTVKKKDRRFAHVYLPGGNVGRSTRVRFELEREMINQFG